MPSVSGFMVAERYMYPGLLGLGLWVGAVIPVGRLSIGLASVLVLLAGSVHLQRAAEWKNDRSLFIAAVVDAPKSSLSWHFNSVVCKREGNWGCVANSAHRSLVLGHPPNEVTTLATFLEALVEIDRPDIALEWAEGRPDHAMESDYFMWAWVRAAVRNGQPDRARKILSSISRPEGWVPPDPLLELMLNLSEEAAD
jgi:hypothetical protein